MSVAAAGAGQDGDVTRRTPGTERIIWAEKLCEGSERPERDYSLHPGGRQHG